MNRVVTEYTVLSRNEKLLANEIGAETVMMSIEDGKYYGMNKTGSYIWKQLSSPITFNELCNKLSACFDIPREKCKEETHPFIEEMVKENIILVD